MMIYNDVPILATLYVLMKNNWIIYTFATELVKTKAQYEAGAWIALLYNPNLWHAD